MSTGAAGHCAQPSGIPLGVGASGAKIGRGLQMLGEPLSFPPSLAFTLVTLRARLTAPLPRDQR